MKKLLVLSLIGVLAAGVHAQPQPAKGTKPATKPIATKTGGKKMGMRMRHGRMVHPGVIMDRRFARLMLKGDARGLSRMYAADAIVFPPDADMVRGRRNIEKMFHDLFSMGKVTEFKLHEIRHEMAGGTCFGAGTATMTFAPNGGAAAETHDFRFTEVARNYKGHWLFTSDHVSMPVKMGPPPGK